MIIEFYIENFRSIKGRAMFTLIADSGKNKSDNTFTVQLSDKRELRLLKTAVVYGANASGKSNFIKAFAALKSMVMHSVNFKINEEITAYEPFELEVNSLRQASIFELYFILNKTKYKYEIAFNARMILSESLDYYPAGQPANLFKRTHPTDDEDIAEVALGRKLSPKRNIRTHILTNQLYLSGFGSEAHPHLTQVYKYFSELQIWNVSDDLDLRQLNREVSAYLADPDRMQLRASLSKLIRVADTKIESVYAKALPEDEFNFPSEIPETVRSRFIEQNKLRVFATHRRYDKDEAIDTVDFDFNEKESNGTKVLLALGGVALAAIEKGGVVIFDELDNSLHPKLCKFLIRLFNNPVSNPHNAQLIFATHEVTLLDKEVFRKDQIWFTEKDKRGKTELYRANTVEGLRDDTNFELWYRTGKFGANPKIKALEFIFNE